MSSEADFLRKIASNQSLLEDDRQKLYQIAEQLEFLQDQCDKYRTERDDAWYDILKLERELEDAIINKAGSTRAS